MITNYFISIVLVVIMFLFGSCSKNNAVSKEEFKLDEGKFLLKAGECSPEDKNSVKVCFQKLITDSRCPTGAVCVWAGYASGTFLFTDGQQSIVFTLSTINSGIWHKDTTINNSKISLVDISPYPSIHGSPSPVNAIIEIN